MKVQVLENTDVKLKLVIEGVNHAFVNAIRRSLIAEVPKLAFDDITIYDNTSALFDEMLAHRIGLVPVTTDLATVVPRDACECAGEGCPNCTVLFTLSKEGPCTVYSGDMQPAVPGQDMPDKNIPLVKLREGQRVMLEAAAILGTSPQHAKWQPVPAAAYREYPVIEIKDGHPLAPQIVQRFQELAPANSVEVRDGKIHVLDLERGWDFLWAARDALELDHVELTTEPGKFIFWFETDGSLKPEVALRYVLDLLTNKLKEVETEAPSLAPVAAE